MKVWILAGGLGVCALLAPRSARAAGSAVWWVEATGEACASERASFEREVTLACAAVGDTCRVAKAKQDAELVAIVTCATSDGSWTLETRTVEGAIVGFTELAGATDDRMREAAMEVARDAAPERTLAIESLKYTLTDADAPVSPPPRASRFAIGASGRGSVHSTASATGGGSLFAGVRTVGSLVLLGKFGMEGGGSGFEEYRDVRFSTGFGWGAPVDPTSVAGVSFTAGVDAIESYINLAAQPPAAADPTRSHTTLGGFADATFFLQWPAGDFRPFAALTASIASQSPEVGGTAELGLTIGLF